MLNCPRCQMLMEDHEPLCAVCAAEAAAAPRLVERMAVPGVTAGGALAGGAGSGSATALLERPTAIPMPTSVTYRGVASRRTNTRIGVLVVLVVVVLGAVGVMTAKGEGPLAGMLIEAGVLEAAPVTVPDSWMLVTSSGGAFRVDLPAHATELDLSIDPSSPAAATTFGYQASLGEGGSTVVISSDLGMGGGVGALDDPTAFTSLVDSMVGGLLGTSPDGRETVRRDVPVGNGRAVDVVIVDDRADSTIRAHYLLAGDRVYAMVTRGVDEGGEALDEVHARVVDSFRVGA